VAGSGGLLGENLRPYQKVGGGKKSIERGARSSNMREVQGGEAISSRLGR